MSSRAEETPWRFRRFAGSRLGFAGHAIERRAPVDPVRGIDVTSKGTFMGFGRWRNSEVFGGGSFKRDRANNAAAGESIERYALSCYDPDHLRVATFGETLSTGLDLEAYRWFLPEQEAQTPRVGNPRSEDRVCWTKLPRPWLGCEQDVPASLVFLPYAYRSGELPLSPQLSPGTSCHLSFHKAAVSALLELIERDSLTLFWETKTAAPLVMIGQEWSDDVSRILHRTKAAIECFDLTTDLGVPVVLTLVTDSSGRGPEVSIGIAAGLSLNEAVEKSVQEGITSWRSTAFLWASDDRSREEIFAELCDKPQFSLHALYHAKAGGIESFRFLRRSVDPGVVRAPKIDLQATDELALQNLVRVLEEAGHPTLVGEITPCDVREWGFHVVRVVVPTLVRQSIGLRFRHLGSRRFETFFRFLGREFHHREMIKILNDPTPFP